MSDIIRKPARQIVDPATALAEIGGEDNPAFLHAVLCQVGLPRSPSEDRVFIRSSGSASLRLEAGQWFDGRGWADMPLPSGTRPRLVLFHVCSEAVRARSPVVEVEDSVRAFLRRLRIDTNGRHMKAFRQQMLALAACRMQLGYKTADRVVNLKCDPIDEFEAWVQTDDTGQRAMWPGVITLSGKFFDTLVEHAVPLDPGAIGELQNSALALDVYTWLAHRLCRVRQNAGTSVSWSALKGQFGQEYRSEKDFKRELVSALAKVLPVYPGARVEKIRGGLRLMPSPPPVRRKGVVVALPDPKVVLRSDTKVALRSAPEGSASVHGKVRVTSGSAVGATAPAEHRGALAINTAGIQPKAAELPKAPLISEDALAQVRSVAPGWDKYFLAARYTEWMKSREHPTNPDAAFLGWVKRFTKGKPPG